MVQFFLDNLCFENKCKCLLLLANRVRIFTDSLNPSVVVFISCTTAQHSTATSELHTTHSTSYNSSTDSWGLQGQVRLGYVNPPPLEKSVWQCTGFRSKIISSLFPSPGVWCCTGRIRSRTLQPRTLQPRTFRPRTIHARTLFPRRFYVPICFIPEWVTTNRTPQTMDWLSL